MGYSTCNQKQRLFDNLIFAVRSRIIGLIPKASHTTACYYYKGTLYHACNSCSIKTKWVTNTLMKSKRWALNKIKGPYKQVVTRAGGNSLEKVIIGSLLSTRLVIQVYPYKLAGGTKVS